MIRKLIPIAVTSALIVALCVPLGYVSGANFFWIQNSDDQFNAGILTDVQVVGTGTGASVKLATTGWGTASANKIANPGAESGTSNWVVIGPNSGSFTAGTGCSSGDNGPYAGSNCFYWDPNSSSDDWAYQTVNLVSYGAYIDNELLQVHVGGYCISSQEPDDKISMKAELLDELLDSLGFVWERYDVIPAGTVYIPVGNEFIPIADTRYVRLYFQAYEDGGSDAGNVDSLSCTVKTRTFLALGTLESSIYDAGDQYNYWDDIEWGETLHGQTLKFKVRTGNNPDLSDADTWASAPYVNYSDDISGLSSVNDGDHYIQYLTELSTTDNLLTPVLHYVSIEYHTNTDPDAPTNLELEGYADGSWIDNNTPTLNFDQSDPDGDKVQYRIQLDDTDNTFSSPEVDYTSVSAAPDGASFTVGQALDGGAYAEGDPGQTLDDGFYYWRVMSIDDDLAESGWAVANGGNVAFRLDTDEEAGGSGKDRYITTEDVQVTAGVFLPGVVVHVYVVGDYEWADGYDIPPAGGDIFADTLLTADGNGQVQGVIWEAPLEVGEYDIVFDADNNLKYDVIPDLVDDPHDPGFTVIAAGVGGEVYPIDKAALLLPWLGLSAVLILAGGSLILVRRRTNK